MWSQQKKSGCSVQAASMWLGKMLKRNNSIWKSLHCHCVLTNITWGNFLTSNGCWHLHLCRGVFGSYNMLACSLSLLVKLQGNIAPVKSSQWICKIPTCNTYLESRTRESGMDSMDLACTIHKLLTLVKREF